MVNSIEIEYLEPKNEFRVGNVKNIAVPANNVNDIKKMYPGSKKTVSNADMLSQSFGTTPEITPIPASTENTPVENVSEPVQISPIPVVQNTNLESEPVNLDVNVSIPEIPSQAPVLNNIPELTPIEQSVNIQPIDSVKETTIEENNNVVTSNEIEQNSNPLIESAFKVSDAPNIFDNPISTNPLGENNNVVDSANAFNHPVQDEPKEPENVSDYKSDLNDDIITAEIAILENNIKHYEGLAENNRKLIELKRKQIKKEENDVNLENTASNLFTNSGVLDDDMVLGKTPMPNLRAA